jgi:hypothetical protein
MLHRIVAGSTGSVSFELDEVGEGFLGLRTEARSPKSGPCAPSRE